MFRFRLRTLFFLQLLACLLAWTVDTRETYFFDHFVRANPQSEYCRFSGGAIAFRFPMPVRLICGNVWFDGKIVPWGRIFFRGTQKFIHVSQREGISIHDYY